MTILEGDIKLLKSQVMDDVDEGGGRATGNQIVDGSSNSIFPDISELDRAYGRVNLRKVFVAVTTPNTDSYYGANVIISDPPDDPKVSCTLFTTHDGFDRRTDAKSQLESYVVAGPLDNMIPYGQQVVGQRAVLAYQRVEHPLPEVGQVFALGMENGANKQQYIRVVEFTSSIQTFEDDRGTFDRRVILITTSEALRYTFPGEEPQRVFNSALYPNSSRIRKTTVLDIARYYGALPMALPASFGAFTLKVDSIYTPLVPSSTIETPVVSATIQNSTIIVPSGDSVNYGGGDWLNGSPMYFGGAIAPNTLTLTTTGAVGTYNPKKDDGAGNIINSAGTVLGSVDYSTGSITPDLTISGAWSGAHAVSYTYGSQQQQSSFTDGTEITLANRGSVYIKTMRPIPSPGTVTVDFMALGKWYRLRDANGDGTLSGDETAYGSGSVNYNTGTVVVTLGALPDVGSDVIFTWGTKVDTFVRDTPPRGLFNRFVVSKGNADRASLSVSIVKGGVTKTLTDDGAGHLSGDGLTGTVDYNTGTVEVNSHRDYNTNITVTYLRGAVAGTPAVVEQTFSSIDREADRSMILQTHPTTAILPRTLRMQYRVVPKDSVLRPPTSVGREVVLIDNGTGNIIRQLDNGVVGTVNYTTGEIHFQPVHNETFTVHDYASAEASLTGVVVSTLEADIPTYQNVRVSFQTAGSMATTATETETFNTPLFAKIGDNEKIVSGGLVFKVGTTRYVDRAGQLYSAIDLHNGSGVLSGSVDYANGEIQITKWPLSDPLAFDIQSCLTYIEGRGIARASFRTTGAPIRPGSFYLQATALDGTLISATADVDGNVTGANVTGKVRSTTGSAQIKFGQMVTAAGNESTWWYDAANVVGGMIFKPKLVDPMTIQYNTVVTSTLPLDSSVLGIDPVRLPPDGRVPIVRAGDVVVIHHTTKTTPQTVTNGQTVNVGRTRLSRLRVFGANGNRITAGFTTDLDAGTVTFSNVSGYSQPVSVEHRIEDMALVTDAQLNGSIRLSRPLTHDFPSGSYISSALKIADMKARVPVIFDQASWNGTTWSDLVSGSPATATFNDALAPIQVTNSGAITERWVVQFSNTTTFQIIGEHVGVIAVGNTTTDCAPINPASGDPYFIIPAIGWGSGWSVGNVLRFNTVGALVPVWISRTIQQGVATVQDDAFTILIRGDVDRA